MKKAFKNVAILLSGSCFLICMTAGLLFCNSCTLNFQNKPVDNIAGDLVNENQDGTEVDTKINTEVNGV